MARIPVLPVNLHKQRGVALLAFTVALAIVAFTIVLGISVSATKKQVISLDSNQKAYLADVRNKLAAAYAVNSFQWGASDASIDSDTLLATAGVSKRWGIRAIISPRISREGVSYRVLAAWLPLDSDVVDEPSWTSLGVFSPCLASDTYCQQHRRYVVVSDGFLLERNNVKKANAQLEQLAVNAQSFMKAKTLLDPERNVSTNYFRPPYGGCNPVVEQMPCIESPEPLSNVPANAGGQYLTELLGLPSGPVVNPWGLPVYACNGASCSDLGGDDPLVKWDPATQGPPYSMVFQTTSPWGSVYRIYAVQQL